MLNRRQLTRVVLTLAGALGEGLMPVLAGSAAVGSVAGSRNATLSGAAMVANTTVFSGDNLQVRDGVAVVALDEGNRMVFGQQTEASFLREAKEVTALLRRGDVSLYHPGASSGVQVKAGGVTVTPAAAPAPTPAAPADGNPHITTATTLGVLGVGAGSAAAVLAGLGLSRSNDAKTAANNATIAGNNATAAANAAGAAANAAGCAVNVENATENPGTPSPYTPPNGYSCP